MVLSSRDKNSVVFSNTITLLPKAANIEANSNPMYPPPMMTRVSGSRSSSRSEVLVYTRRLSRIPDIGGITGRAPVSIKIRFPSISRRSVSVVTSILRDERNEATPVYTVIFGWSLSRSKFNFRKAVVISFFFMIAFR